MGKITNIQSEIRNFFSEKRRSMVMDTFTRLLEGLNMDSRSLGGLKRENCQLTNLQVFQILLLLPFFAIKGFSHYDDSALCRMFGGKKDILYSYLSQDNINWRNVVYLITNWLLTKVTVRQDHKKSLLPNVLIADDTDLPKTGMHMESISKIFSHVHQKCILGYKALMLCWSDGRTQIMLDFSLHGEKGKVDGKEQGLTSKQRNGRYERKRDEKSHIAKRKKEYFMGKSVKLLDMVKNAIRNKIPSDYLLVDSWFTCTELVDFVYRRHKKFHLLGMAKMGNTKYVTTDWGKLSAKAIITKLKAKKEVRYSRRYHCHYAEIEVVLGKRSVKLFFCKRGKKDAWKVLLTTDPSLRFMRAYEIYSMRWGIEVFFSDSKRLLGLADCSSRDFSAHMAHVSLVMIRYNMLASIKRTLDYDTIGGLFGDMYLGVHELTMVEKIWAIIIEVVAVVAELTGADSDELTIQIIENDKRLAALRAHAQTALNLNSKLGYANNCMMLHAHQTPSTSELKLRSMTLVQHYIAVIKRYRKDLLEVSDIIVADAFFSIRPFVDGIKKHGFNLVNRFRDTASLHYVYTGPRSKKPGRPKTLDGKINYKKLDLTRMAEMHIDGLEGTAYTLIAYSKALKQKVRLVIWVMPNGRHKLFFSTKTSMSGEDVLRTYRSRFQIEFCFRDAKQFTGLTHCQARHKNQLDFSYNASFASQNVAKVMMKENGLPYSMASFKELMASTYIAKLIFDKCRNTHNRKLISHTIKELFGWQRKAA